MHPSYDAEAARRVLSQNDPTLGMLIARVGPYQLTLRHMQSPFLGLLRIHDAGDDALIGGACGLSERLLHPRCGAMASSSALF